MATRRRRGGTRRAEGPNGHEIHEPNRHHDKGHLAPNVEMLMSLARDSDRNSGRLHVKVPTPPPPPRRSNKGPSPMPSGAMPFGGDHGHGRGGGSHRRGGSREAIPVGAQRPARRHNGSHGNHHGHSDQHSGQTRGGRDIFYNNNNNSNGQYHSHQNNHSHSRSHHNNHSKLAESHRGSSEGNHNQSRHHNNNNNNSNNNINNNINYHSYSDNHNPDRHDHRSNGPSQDYRDNPSRHTEGRYDSSNNNDNNNSNRRRNRDSHSNNNNNDYNNSIIRPSHNGNYLAPHAITDNDNSNINSDSFIYSSGRSSKKGGSTRDMKGNSNDPANNYHQSNNNNNNSNNNNSSNSSNCSNGHHRSSTSRGEIDNGAHAMAEVGTPATSKRATAGGHGSSTTEGRSQPERRGGHTRRGGGGGGAAAATAEEARGGGGGGGGGGVGAGDQTVGLSRSTTSGSNKISGLLAFPAGPEGAGPPREKVIVLGRSFPNSSDFSKQGSQYPAAALQSSYDEGLGPAASTTDGASDSAASKTTGTLATAAVAARKATRRGRTRGRHGEREATSAFELAMQETPCVEDEMDDDLDWAPWGVTRPQARLVEVPRFPEFARLWRHDWKWDQYIVTKGPLVRVEVPSLDLGDSDLASLMPHLDEVLKRHVSKTMGRYILNIDLSCNRLLSDDGIAQHLAPFLHTWPQCQRLKLYKTSIGDGALAALSSWVAEGHVHELHLSDLGAQVSCATVYNLLKEVHDKGNYPYLNNDNTRCALWLRLEHNNIQHTEQLINKARADGISVTVVQRPDLGQVRPGAPGGGGSKNQTEVPALNLVLFHKQELRVSRRWASAFLPMAPVSDDLWSGMRGETINCAKRHVPARSQAWKISSSNTVAAVEEAQTGGANGSQKPASGTSTNTPDNLESETYLENGEEEVDDGLEEDEDEDENDDDDEEDGSDEDGDDDDEEEESDEEDDQDDSGESQEEETDDRNEVGAEGIFGEDEKEPPSPSRNAEVVGALDTLGGGSRASSRRSSNADCAEDEQTAAPSSRCLGDQEDSVATAPPAMTENTDKPGTQVAQALPPTPSTAESDMEGAQAPVEAPKPAEPVAEAPSQFLPTSMGLRALSALGFSCR